MNEIYRDPTEGAQARRLELLRRRRDELVTMPHAIRRVAVARAARSAASLTALVLGSAMLALVASPHAAALVARALPGPGPAPIASFAAAAWLVALVVYVAARAMHEHRFAVAMSRYVLPGDDLDVDLERLSHERPDTMARVMAHRLEVRSAALPVAAAALVVPAALIYIALAVKARGWPQTSDYEQELAGHAGALGAVALAGLVAAVAMTRRAMRLPAVASIAALVAGTAGVAAVVAATQNADVAGWSALGVFAIAGAIAIVVRRLRIERARIETEDPAAGSDVFTWRGLVRRVRAFGVQLRARIQRRHARRALGACAVVIASYGAYAILHARERTNAPVVHIEALPPPAANAVDVPVALQSTYAVHRTADGQLQVDLQLVDGQPVDLAALAGVVEVPTGWSARVTITSSGDIPVDVTPFPGDMRFPVRRLAGADATTTFELCADHAHLLGLHAASASAAPGVHAVSLGISVTLALASCPTTL